MTIRKVRSSEWVEDKTGSTLAARDYKDSGDLVVEQPAVLMTMREGKPGGGKGPLLAEEQSLTLATGNGQTLFQPKWAANETGALQARQYKGINTEGIGSGQAVVEQYGVRRLAPVECERLQSFPDGWTEPAESDSARYKAMGNAVTVNVVRWILGRLP